MHKMSKPAGFAERDKEILTGLAQGILDKVGHHQASFTWELKQTIDYEHSECPLFLSISITRKRTREKIKYLKDIVVVSKGTPHYRGAYFEFYDDPFDAIVDLIVDDLRVD